MWKANGMRSRGITRAIRWRVVCRLLILVILLLGVTAFLGCATQSAIQLQHAFSPTKHRTVRIERCLDRTDFAGGRDLAEEASQALTKKVRATNLFEFTPDASLVLTCDIESFVEGSAFKRWLLPGWGITQAKVAVVVWEKPGDKILVTLRSHSSVKSGGLYTIGADQYILSVAMDEVVTQLEAWAKGADDTASP